MLDLRQEAVDGLQKLLQFLQRQPVLGRQKRGELVDESQNGDNIRQAGLNIVNQVANANAWGRSGHDSFQIDFPLPVW